MSDGETTEWMRPNENINAEGHMGLHAVRHRRTEECDWAPKCSTDSVAPTDAVVASVKHEVGDGLFDDTTTMVEDPITHAKKGMKIARFDLIPAAPLAELATVYGRGSLKYAERNWEAGYNWSLSFGAMLRHAYRFWRGEDIDPETGVHHMANVAWHAFALMEFGRTKKGKDDRP